MINRFSLASGQLVRALVVGIAALLALPALGYNYPPISQSMSNGGYNLPIGKSLGQSFTATASGNLESLGLSTNGAYLDVELYSGSGRDGTRLYRRSNVFFTNVAPGSVNTHELTQNILVEAGEVYTWVIKNVSPAVYEARFIHSNYFTDGGTDIDAYPAGERFVFDPAGPYPESDLVFQVVISTDLDIEGQGVLIQDGDTTPAVADGTDFGAQEIRLETVTKTYEITNVSGRTLTLSGASITNPDYFSVSRQPATTLANNASTSFDITFAPVTMNSNATAQVTVASTGIPNPYTFSVKGVGLRDTTRPAPVITGPDAILTGPFSVEIDFQEPVIGLEPSDFTVSRARASGMSSLGNGRYRLTIIPTGGSPISVYLASEQATDLSLNNNLSSNAYFKTYVERFDFEDETGGALTSPVVNAGERFAFTLALGSGDFDVSPVTNEYGASGTVNTVNNRTFQFIPATQGAFAGTYEITLTDAVSGWSDTLEIRVPLALTLSRTELLDRGERAQADVTVTGASPGTAISLALASAATEGLPVLAQTELTSADDSPAGHPAATILTSVALPDVAVEFEITASAFGYVSGGASAEVALTAEYRGRVTDYLNGLDEVSVSVLASENDAVELDELGAPYQAQTNALGDFTLAIPDALLATPLTLQFVKDGLAVLAIDAGDCLTEPAGCDVEMVYSQAAIAPAFDQPTGLYQDQVIVELTSATEGATISYTLDGSVPTPAHGQLVNSGDVVILRESAVISALAFAEGLAPSAVSQSGYLIQKTQAPEEPEGENSGSSSGGSMSAWLSLLALLLLTHTRYYRRYRA